MEVIIGDDIEIEWSFLTSEKVWANEPHRDGGDAGEAVQPLPLQIQVGTAPLSMPAMFTHEDVMLEEQVYGRRCFIAGLTPNNAQSSSYIMDVFKLIKPKVLPHTFSW